MAIYFPDGNGGRKVISASDISLAGFSNVASVTGDITDADDLLTALAKLSNGGGGGSASSKTQIPLPTQGNTLTYDGSVQEPVWMNYGASKMTKLANSQNSATDAGTYTVYFSLQEGYEWEDGSLDDKAVTWTIGRAVITNVPVLSGTLTYNGEEQSPTWLYFDENKMSIGSATGTGARTYTANFVPKKNYMWADGTTGIKKVDWTINPMKIAVPVQVGTLTYNGKSQTPTWNNYDTKKIRIGGTLSSSQAGTYTTSFTPLSTNHVWEDGTTTAKEVTWEIKKATATILLPETSIVLYNATAKAEMTVELETEVGSIGNTDFTITVTSANDSLCNAKTSGTQKIVITPAEGRGTTAVTVSAECKNHITTNVAITVDVNTAPINMLTGRTLAQLQSLFRNGQAAKTFKPGDYFNVTFPNDIILDNRSASIAELTTIAANSTYRAVLLGIDHNKSVEGSNRGHFCIGQTTDGKETAFYQRQMNSTATNAGGWGSSELKTWLNDDFYNALPADLKSVIVSCTKYTDNVGGGLNLANNVTATSQKIWLMATYEILGENKSSVNPYETAKQNQYDYYKNAQEFKRVRHNNDTTSAWWLRTPYAVDAADTPNFNEANTCFAIAAGTKVTSGGASTYYGVVPCFVIG